MEELFHLNEPTVEKESGYVVVKQGGLRKLILNTAEKARAEDPVPMIDGKIVLINFRSFFPHRETESWAKKAFPSVQWEKEPLYGLGEAPAYVPVLPEEYSERLKAFKEYCIERYESGDPGEIRDGYLEILDGGYAYYVDYENEEFMAISPETEE